MNSDFTANQKELIDKFNAAFYDAQSLNANETLLEKIDYENEPDENDRLLLENFDETFFTNIDQYENPNNFLLPSATMLQDDAYKYNYEVEYVNYDAVATEKPDEGFSEAFSDGVCSELVTPSSDCTSTFDYDEFSENFEQFNQFHFGRHFESMPTYTEIGGDNHQWNGGEQTVLPPVNTIKNLNWEFGQFLRHQEPSSLSYHQITNNGNDFGHFGNDMELSSASSSPETEQVDEFSQHDNFVVLNQTEALMFDEANLTVRHADGDGKRDIAAADVKIENVATERERTYSTDSDFDEFMLQPYSLQCKWANCYQIYETQSTLVKHIEKSHVELKRGDEFTCFWHNCPRKNKPFNARYKLLIHMRVHSGEKPNKCPFNGCNKAFSRLENLKIHQRSHTGERPYLCQFPTCTKSFSNSSDRAKHQRTHFDTKPYACQIKGCSKKYTDPSSLRKHVKNHSPEEQMQLKCKNTQSLVEPAQTTRLPVISKDSLSATASDSSSARTASGTHRDETSTSRNPNTPSSKNINFYAHYEHDYTATRLCTSFNVKQDLKNKLSERLHRNISFK